MTVDELPGGKGALVVARGGSRATVAKVSQPDISETQLSVRFFPRSTRRRLLATEICSLRRRTPHSRRVSPSMSGSQATARSRELLAVEHNDADAAHPGRILLAGGSEAASPSKVASPVKNGERGANGPIGVGAPRAKPDFSKLPKPPSALLAKLNAFMPKMQAANDTLKEAMKTRPAEDFDIEHVEDDDDASDSDSASDSDTEHMDAEANPDAYKVNAAIRSIEAQQRKDARAAAKAAKGAGAGGGGKRIIEMDVGLGVVDLKTEQALAKATAMAGDAVVGGESSEDTRESGGGRIRLPGQVGDTHGAQRRHPGAQLTPIRTACTLIRDV